MEITVAGHICLDIIPELLSGTTETNLFCPGTLRTVGPATLSTGGVVSNTGQSLYQMGFAVSMAGKVGDDPLGATILEILNRKNSSLAAGMIVAPGQSSSYTVVLNPPGIDRAFLHCPGVNDTFEAQELDADRIAEGRLIHFGYPPLMRAIYNDAGVGLGNKFRELQSRGVLTSLDMANPDPLGQSGQVDWVSWLKNVMPSCDVFLPSFDEITFMLNSARYTELVSGLAAGQTNPARSASISEFEAIATQLIEWGAKVIVLKLGDQGLYVQTADDLSELAQRAKWTDFPWSEWSGKRFAVPCYNVKVVGTTGSGDATVAGFLGAMLKGLPILDAGLCAVSAGGANVTAADATSGVPDWETILEFRTCLGQHAFAFDTKDWKPESLPDDDRKLLGQYLTR